MPYHYFRDDYSEGCHPHILHALQHTNLEQQIHYGNDDYTGEAKALMRQQLGNHEADIYFVSGGTPANLVVVSASLNLMKQWCPHKRFILISTNQVH